MRRSVESNENNWRWIHLRRKSVSRSASEWSGTDQLLCIEHRDLYLLDSL